VLILNSRRVGAYGLSQCTQHPGANLRIVIGDFWSYSRSGPV